MVYFQCLWRIKARQSWALLVEEVGKGAQGGLWGSWAKQHAHPVMHLGIVLQPSFPIYFPMSLTSEALWRKKKKSSSCESNILSMWLLQNMRQFGWNISFLPQFPYLLKKWDKIFLEHFAGCLDLGVAAAIFLVVLTLQVPLDLALPETNKSFLPRNYESLKQLKPAPLK